MARRPNWIYRTTTWSDSRGAVEQVGVAVLDAETWDVLSEAVEQVGPFESLAVVQLLAELNATNAASRQIAGQEELAL